MLRVAVKVPLDEMRQQVLSVPREHPSRLQVPQFAVAGVAAERVQEQVLWAMALEHLRELESDR